MFTGPHQRLSDDRMDCGPAALLLLAACSADDVLAEEGSAGAGRVLLRVTAATAASDSDRTDVSNRVWKST